MKKLFYTLIVVFIATISIFAQNKSDSAYDSRLSELKGLIESQQRLIEYLDKKDSLKDKTDLRESINQSLDELKTLVDLRRQELALQHVPDKKTEKFEKAEIVEKEEVRSVPPDIAPVIIAQPVIVQTSAPKQKTKEIKVDNSEITITTRPNQQPLIEVRPKVPEVTAVKTETVQAQVTKKKFSPNKTYTPPQELEPGGLFPLVYEKH